MQLIVRLDLSLMYNPLNNLDVIGESIGNRISRELAVQVGTLSQ